MVSNEGHELWPAELRVNVTNSCFEHDKTVILFCLYHYQNSFQHANRLQLKDIWWLQISMQGMNSWIKANMAQTNTASIIMPPEVQTKEIAFSSQKNMNDSSNDASTFKISALEKFPYTTLRMLRKILNESMCELPWLPKWSFMYTRCTKPILHASIHFKWF